MWSLQIYCEVLFNYYFIFCLCFGFALLCHYCTLLFTKYRKLFEWWKNSQFSYFILSLSLMAIAFGSSATAIRFLIFVTCYHFPSRPCSSILCHDQLGLPSCFYFSLTLFSDYCKIISAIYAADLGLIVVY